MTMKELMDKAEFVVGANGKKKAVLDLQVWEEIVTLLEDLEDATEIQQLRDAGEETVDWEQVKVVIQQ